MVRLSQIKANIVAYNMVNEGFSSFNIEGFNSFTYHQIDYCRTATHL